MTNKPVAYLNKIKGQQPVLYFLKSDAADENIPLYTKKQLQPRVNMTKKQHKQFEIYKVDKNNFYHFWQSLLCDKISLLDDISERDLMLAWLDDEAIEIVPEKKWFVRSKEPEGEDEDEYYLFLSGSNLDDLEYFEFDYAKKFDTKEEAEKWTNPLTEAVLLPVEGE